MRLVGLTSIALFLGAVTLFMALDEVDAWLEHGRRLARTRHIE